MTQKMYPVSIVIGRWQLPHLAHLGLIQKALSVGERVIIVIGSAMRSRNPKNPFRETERQAMIERMLTPEERQRVTFLMVRDYANDARWVAAVRDGVASISNGAGVALVGFKKDESSYYLDRFPGWTYVDAGSSHDLDATSLRNAYFGSPSVSAAMDVLKPYVHPAVLDYLQSWAELPVFAERQAEYLAVKAYREKYKGPYYLTADSVLEINGHVLLIKRGGVIGHGQWALPGGFLDEGEDFYTGAVRELAEETKFSALASTMESALKGRAVFDHPGRSPRGRLITQAFHFKLDRKTLPEVRGADDAKEAWWCPIEQLPEIEAELFEDHALILDRFIGFIGTKGVAQPCLA